LVLHGSRYDAFISYSHAKDKRIAAALQSALQKLGKPWYRRRALRVFRDDTSLSATPQLWPTIQRALDQSRYFILLASPDAAASMWVNKEVTYWLEHNSIDTLLIAVTDGVLAWDQRVGGFAAPETSPLPRTLLAHIQVEPKWVDLRAYRNGATKSDAKFTELAADLAAAIHNLPKEDLLSLEVRQQRKALTLAWGVAGSLLVLTGVAAWQKQVAQEERDNALLNESRYMTSLARDHIRAGDAVSGMLLALEGLLDRGSRVPQSTRPRLKDAQLALYEGLEAQRETAILGTVPGKPLNPTQTFNAGCLITQISEGLASTCPSQSEVLATTQLTNGTPSVVAISKSGARLASFFTQEKIIRIHDVSQAKEIAQIPVRSAEVSDLKLSADGDYLLIKYSDRSPGTPPSPYCLDNCEASEVDLVRLASGVIMPIAKEVANGAQVMVFSNNGPAFAIATKTEYLEYRLFVCTIERPCRLLGTVKDPSPHHFANELFYDASSQFIAIRFSFYTWPSERLLVDDKQLYLLNDPPAASDDEQQRGDRLAFRRQEATQFSFISGDDVLGSEMTAANFSADGKNLFIALRNGVVKLAPLSSDGHEAQWQLAGHVGAIRYVNYERDSSRIITIGEDQTVRIWTVAPEFNWGQELGLPPLKESVETYLELRPSAKIEIILDLQHQNKAAFREKIEELLVSPDPSRVQLALKKVPRCLEPARRKELNLQPEPPLWCLGLSKWPYSILPSSTN
jgi:hypothetical protein